MLDLAASIVVVGAGVIGLSVAYELLCRGQRVVVLERDRPGAGASAVAAGMLAVAAEVDVDPPEVTAFALASAALYPDFVRHLERISGVACGLRAEGTLSVALDRDDVAELDRLHAMQTTRGLAGRWLTGAEARLLEPGLCPRVTAGLLLEQDRSVDARALLRALVVAVEKLGGRIERAAVVSIEPRAHGVGIVGRRKGDAFEAIAEAVVLSAGAWSTASIRCPIEEAIVRPVKGQTVRLSGAPLIRHCIRTPRVYLVPRSSGELIVGGTTEERGFDESARAGAARELLRDAWEVLPGIDDLGLEESCVGFRPTVRDHLPVLGASGIEGLYLATGHSRHGILLAPATARELAELVVTGRDRPLLRPFARARLGGGVR